MIPEPAKKLEMFLLLALRGATPFAAIPDDSENGKSSAGFLDVFTEQLSAAESEEIARLYSDYQNKSGAEKAKWQRRIETYVGTDEPQLDEHLHTSHIDSVLAGETASIRKILVAAIAEKRSDYKRNELKHKINPRRAAMEKAVRRSFVKRFVSQRDLPEVLDFDRLNGAQLARLIRLAGIREVAQACVRITAVESIAAFLRRFPAEDARSIAGQLNNLPKISAERLLFAENLVQNALETDMKPSAMLDLLGLWLFGIFLGSGARTRLVYTSQKLPLEVSAKLSEIIKTRKNQASLKLQPQIGQELEQLAETILKAVVKLKL